MDYQKNFEKSKAMLNDSQRKAVITIFGPVLVIAGPGTGKTQVLATRIAEILTETDSNPNQILALTFTEAGVTAMRDRLRSLIGPDAHAVKINTFHGFCAEIISRFPEKFIFSKKLETADTLARIGIIKSILETRRFRRLSPFAAPNYFLQEILSKLSSLKRENVDPTNFSEIVASQREEFDSIPDDEKVNPKTGKWKGKYVDQESAIAKWEELGQIYQDYQTALKTQGLMDFDDQILFVLNAIKNDQDLRLTLQEENLFFLADEFQDSNGAQMELLELLSGSDETPNLFVVGDDDQSIYRFQGANLENIVHFLSRYPTAVRIPLTENYRSTKQILDFAESSIANSTERLTRVVPDLDKHLTSGLQKNGELPVKYEFDTSEAEQYFVLTKIKELRQTGVKLSEIAILARTNAEGQRYLHYFENNDLPAVFAARSNVLKDMRIRQLLSILRLIENPDDNALFFELLHHPLWNIPAHQIWQAWRFIKQNKTTFYEFFCDCENEAKQELLNKQNISDSLKGSIQIICHHLSEWNKDRHNLVFASFFQKILTDSGLLEFLLTEKERLESLNHLHSLFAEVKNLSRNNPDFSLSEFLSIIDLHEEFEVAIDSRMLQTPEDSVRILTAHGAKGLEFDNVFVTGLAGGVWGDRRNMNKISLPDGLLSLPYSAIHENEEERRLFFVSITRARKQLFLSFAKTSFSGKSQSQSRFLDEIDSNCFASADSEPYEKQVFERLKAELLYQAPDLEAKERSLVQQIIDSDRFAISPTAFEHYRECPRKFFYENVLRVPHVKPATAALGTAMHYALEIFFATFSREGTMPGKSLLLSTFSNALKKEILSDHDFNEAEEWGKEYLSGYFVYYQSSFEKPIATEMDFSAHGIRLNHEVPITGKIDKIEWLDMQAKTVRIIDYKTTTPKSENVLLGQTSSQKNDVNAGSMYRQLQFYSLLAKNSNRFPWSAERFQIDFLKPDKAGKYIRREFMIQEQDTQILQQEIMQMWQDVKSLAFLQKKDTCKIAEANHGKCDYCRLFTKESNL